MTADSMIAELVLAEFGKANCAELPAAATASGAAHGKRHDVAVFRTGDSIMVLL